MTLDEMNPSPSRSYMEKANLSFSSLVFLELSPCSWGLKCASTIRKSWKSTCSSSVFFLLPWKKAWMILSPRGLRLSSLIQRKSFLVSQPLSWVSRSLNLL